ncbi:MAG: DNA mismatch repair endonuclease MutL [Ahrensia sp.]
MVIKRLDETLINQIAAGEVVERPASAAKELIENALDAGASRIEIATTNGGKSLLRVIDNGHGMAPDQLALAVSRHCTSKLDGGLNAIATLGFRGEALPSIGSVARLSIRSRPALATEGHVIHVNGGVVDGPLPVAANPGTIVEVADLFHATPARLKFMKTAQAENAAISDVVKRIAMAFPAVSFVLSGNDRGTLDYRAKSADGDGQRARIAQIIGQDFIDNAVEFAEEREGVRVGGFVSLPSFNRANSLQQYAYVNGRPIKDRQILGALRGAYSDMLARNRHCVAVIFIETHAADVDVNVHPAKADVRFRDPGLVRSLIVGGIRRALSTSGIRASTHDARNAMAAFSAPSPSPSPSSAFQNTQRPPEGWQHPLDMGFGETPQTGFAPSARAEEPVQPTTQSAPIQKHPLGAARAQIDNTYIVAQTETAMVLVDQHAAHERLVYERLKNALDAKQTIPAQMLLVPEIVDMAAEDAERLLAQADAFAALGLILEGFGPGAIAVRGTPSMLGECNAAGLVRDIADELAEAGTSLALRDAIERVASSMACHGSVRAGRSMRVDEMNALLRQMEATPGSGTCNHGRPTFIELQLADIERMFGRR